MLTGKWRTIGMVAGGCLGLPVLLVGGCAGKMQWDAWKYELPGPVLASSSTADRELRSPFEVAETLDAYVQPRFEILRDKNFGAFRIVYRRHAGIVQLKVDTPRERQLIANANAARRDYAISLLHCAPTPQHGFAPDKPVLDLLYFNQRPIAGESEYWIVDDKNLAAEGVTGFSRKAVEQRAIAALPQLRAGKEHKDTGTSWDSLMRPVPATAPCLGCHRSAKLGDTLGVMVYSVRKTVRLADLPAPSYSLEVRTPLLSLQNLTATRSPE